MAPSLGGESVILMESKGADPWAELDLGMVGVRLERREKRGWKSQIDQWGESIKIRCIFFLTRGGLLLLYRLACWESAEKQPD